MSNDTDDIDFNHICLCDFISLHSHRTSPSSWNEPTAGSAKNNRLFSAIYLNLSKRHCWSPRCYGSFSLFFFFCSVCNCGLQKYTGTCQCVMSILFCQFCVRVRCIKVSLSPADTHTHKRKIRANQLQCVRRLNISQ